MRPWWSASGHPLPKTPRQKWIETKESWERSRHIEVPAPVPAAPPRPGGLRVAFLIYRGNPRCGGQGVYTRHLTRELVALGHSVEVFAGPPWPELDPGVGFTPGPRSRPLPRTPTPSGSRTGGSSPPREDWIEFGIMCTAGFGEPLAYSLRARQLLAERRDDFDVVHDNQCLGTGHARHGRGRVAPAHHAAPSDHGGPPARALAHDQPLAAFHHAPLVRLPRHAGAGGPGPAPPW